MAGAFAASGCVPACGRERGARWRGLGRLRDGVDKSVDHVKRRFTN
jgi:hypothetical protein